MSGDKTGSAEGKEARPASGGRNEMSSGSIAGTRDRQREPPPTGTGTQHLTRPSTGCTRPAALRTCRERRLTQRLQRPHSRTWGPVQTHRRTKRLQETAALVRPGCASLETGSWRPGSSHNPHLVPTEAFGRMCQASRGGAGKRLDPAHSTVPGAPPLVTALPAPRWCLGRVGWFMRRLGTTEAQAAPVKKKILSTHVSGRCFKLRVNPVSLKRK